MLKFRRFTFPAALCASLLMQPTFAQNQPTFRRSICTKVQPGKSQELEDLLSKAAFKVSQYNISQGKLARYAVMRNVYPAGSSAECDYISSFFYSGPPPDTTQEATSASWAAAKVGMTYEGFLAKLNSIGHTVRVELYASVARAGAAKVGDYVSLNQMKVPDADAWGKLETEIWKPIQEARIKDGQMDAWGTYYLIMPSGSGLPYQASTVDIYPSWEAIWNQKPLEGYVKQTHPDLSYEKFGEDTGKARDLVSRELFKIILAAGSLPQ
jgi:hypothetical protein